MGQRGPKPTPTKLLTARGSPWKTRERRGKNEPKPRPGDPKRPAWLPSRCWPDWHRILRDIHPGVATTLDRNALARYVVLIDQWKSAMDYIERNGTTFEEKRILGATTKGQVAEIVTVGVREVPHVKQARQIEDQLLKLETAFGLTPSARARLTIPEQEQTKTGAAKYALTG